jgi:hypothetical protein
MSRLVEDSGHTNEWHFRNLKAERDALKRRLRSSGRAAGDVMFGFLLGLVFWGLIAVLAEHLPR